VVLDGKAINQYKPKELARMLGVVHQQNVAPADMTVEKLVYYGRLPHKKAFSLKSEQDEAMVEWALKCTGLYDKRHDLIDTLSGGQQQRAWIAMALAENTPLLFLDEPTAKIDIYYQYDDLEMIKQLYDKHNLTIVMELHEINQAIQHYNTVIYTTQGRSVARRAQQTHVTKQLLYELYSVNVNVKQV